MSTPTPETEQSTPSLEVDFKLHLEHMDLHFSVANGDVRLDASDFVRLMEQAKPQHAGLFADTLKQVLALTTDRGGQPAAAAQPSAHRRMFDVVARVDEIRDLLDKTLDDVTGELARLTAMPPIFDDVRDPKSTPPAATQPPAAQPAPSETPEAAPTAPTTTAPLEATPAATAPTATTEPAATTPAANS